MTPPLIIQINYFEQGQSIDDACRLAAAVGGDGIEFRSRPVGSSASEAERHLDDIARSAERYKIRHVMLGSPGPDIVSLDEETRKREIDFALTLYRKASAKFPLKLVNLFTGQLVNPDPSLPRIAYSHHGSTIASQEQWDNVREGMRPLAEMALELDLRFAFETHGCYLHDTLEATMKLVDMVASPSVGILWDHANLMIFPNAPTLDVVVNTAIKSLFSVHLKNVLIPPERFYVASSLSGGMINIREQIRLLAQAGYDGPICLECPRPGDRLQFLKEDIAYARELLEDYESQRERSASSV